MTSVIRELHAITEASLSGVSIEGASRALLGRARRLVRADAAAVLVRSATTRQWAVLVADGDVEGIDPGARLPLRREPADGIPVDLEPSDDELVESPFRRAGLCSVVRVPLMVESRVIGVVDAASADPKCFTTASVRLLKLVADRLALAIDYVRLRDVQQRLTERADRAQRQWAFLIEAGEILHAARDITGGLAAVCDRAVRDFSDWCSIALLTPTGDILRAAMAHRDPDALALLVRSMHGTPSPLARHTAWPRSCGPDGWNSSLSWWVTPACATGNTYGCCARSM